MKNPLILLLVIIPLMALSRGGRKKTDPDFVKREEMLTMSRHLGVTCNYCHNINNFKSKKMKTYKISLDHIRITHLLNSRGFKKHISVDCYFCHRGKAIPDYKEESSSHNVHH